MPHSTFKIVINHDVCKCHWLQQRVLLLHRSWHNLLLLCALVQSLNILVLCRGCELLNISLLLVVAGIIQPYRLPQILSHTNPHVVAVFKISKIPKGVVVFEQGIEDVL